MKKCGVFLVALAILLVFGMAVVSCATTTPTTGGEDSSLNGTWVSGVDQQRFDRGSFVFSSNGQLLQKGNYKTSGSNITLTPTHAYVAQQWYTRSELSSMGGVSTSDLNTLFGTWTGTVNSNGNTLTLRYAGLTEVFTNTSRPASSASSAPSQTARYMLVNADSLNVRSGPSADTALVGSLPRNTRVEVLERPGTWWRIRSGNITGYVNSSYLKAE